MRRGRTFARNSGSSQEAWLASTRHGPRAGNPASPGPAPRILYITHRTGSTHSSNVGRNSRSHANRAADPRTTAAAVVYGPPAALVSGNHTSGATPTTPQIAIETAGQASGISGP